MIGGKQVAWSPLSKPSSRNASTRVPGTSLSVAEVYAIMVDRRGCEELFRRFPNLDPNDLRDAIERAIRSVPAKTADSASSQTLSYAVANCGSNDGQTRG